MSNTLPQRKHPVHMLPMERHNDPIIVFVTIGIQPRFPALSNIRLLSAFSQACADADAWSVGRFMIMPDHIHLFCSPAKWPLVSIKRWVGYLKERITKRLKKRLGPDLSRTVEGQAIASGRRLAVSRIIANGSAQPRPPSDTELVMEGEPACQAAASEQRLAVSRDPLNDLVMEGALIVTNGSAQRRPPSDTELVMEGEPVVSLVDTNRFCWKWQSDCWDTQMRNQDHYHQKWEYVRQNPVRKGLVNRVEDWPWQGELHSLRW